MIRRGTGFPTAIALALVAVLAAVPAAQARKTLFVVGSGTSSVAAHNIGALGNQHLGLINAVATGSAPRAAVVSPDARHVYVSANNGGNGVINFYDIDAGGAISQPSISPAFLGAGASPDGMGMTPNGQFLIVADGGANGVRSFLVDQASGGLTQITGSPFPAPGAEAVAISPDGQRVYVTENGGVRTFSIAADGSLNPIGGVVPAGTAPEGIAITPDGRFVYVGNTGSANLFAYSVDASGGLTQVGSPAATGNTPRTVAITSNGRFVYTANFGNNNVSGFAIGADGTLSAVPNQPFPAGTQVFGLDANPSGQNVFASNFNGNGPASLDLFGIGASGELSPVSGSPFGAGVNGSEFQSVAITPNQGPVAQFTAAPQQAGFVSRFDARGSTDPDGTNVVGFVWDFGDGETSTEGSIVDHTYRAGGTYTVTLTVVDQEGCSTTTLFTGQTADCVGNSAARTQQTVVVPPDDELDLDLSGKKKQKLSKTVKVKAKTQEESDAVASGKLAITSSKKGKSALASIKLKKDRAHLAAGAKTTLKPKLSKKAYKKANRALSRGGKVKAKISVSATGFDDADSDKAKRTVTLKKP